MALKKFDDYFNERNPKSHIISEGVQYDTTTNTFTFDFEHDNETDIIKLERIGYSVEGFGNCYHFGYAFADDVDSKVRSEFIRQVKFPESFDNQNDLSLFISKAAGYLNTAITLPRYNVIVYPQSVSELNRKMMSVITRLTTATYIEIELVKNLPAQIEFDYDRYKVEVLDSTINGKPRYTPAQKEEAMSNIDKMMQDIHNLDYFSIARNVKKAKLRPFIRNFYKFKDAEAEKVYKELMSNNVILIDDVVTSGTTILNMLNTLRFVNDTNSIVVFSLIGNKNLNNIVAKI